APSDAGFPVLVDGPFCSQAPRGFALCEDFDDPSTQSRWRPYAHGGGAIAVDDAAALSPPNSLLVSFPPAASGTGTQAWWSTTLPSTANELDVQFAVQMKGRRRRFARRGVRLPRRIRGRAPRRVSGWTALLPHEHAGRADPDRRRVDLPRISLRRA